MAETVIGFFDDPTEAQTAVQRLENSGISRERIDLSTGKAGTGNVDSDNNTTSERRDSDGDHENGITRFFKNLFGSDDNDADRYSRVAQNSNSIVTVHAQSRDEAETAADILDDCGAVDVDERASKFGYSSNRQNVSNDRNESDTTINRIEENLEVGKKTVEQGGVRVRSRIIEKPVEESVRLREERINVERNPVDRKVSGDELSNFKEQDIELTERSEVPVVNKEARVVEEVHISKDVNEREETIRDTVRNTDVDIENIDRGTRSSNKDVTNNDMDNDNLSRDRNI